jgi:trimeric autotransporter adhesin
MKNKTITLTTLTVLLFLSKAFTQVLPFADFNQTDAGTFPNHFVEFNNSTYFINTFGLCKTDGTNSGTQIVDSANVVGHHYYQLSKEFNQYLYIFNSELYYFKYVNTNYQLWKTDGANKQLVLNNFPLELNYTKLYFINNNLCYFSGDKLYKIENNNSVLLGTFLNSQLEKTCFNPVATTNLLIFFTFETKILKVWKSDGTVAGTGLVGNISNFDNAQLEIRQLENLKCTLLNNAVYIYVPLIIGSFTYNLELWKTDGQSLNQIKLLVANTGYGRVFNLTTKNGKMLFNYNENQLWMSDGTATGTSSIKSFSLLPPENSFKKWGYFNGFYYFGAKETTNFELWKTDGTSSGTSKIYNFGTTGSSGYYTPSYFIETNTDLYFIANQLELWKTDGSTSGTSKINQYILPLETQSVGYFNVFYPEIFKNSNNQLFWRNWGVQNGFELWKSNSTIENSTLLKNIGTNTNNSLLNDVKLKVGNVWFFNGINNKGAELWKSDGTPSGTSMVKDLTIGHYNTYISAMTSMNGILYFIASNADGLKGVYRSDGTEAGTYEVAPSIRGYFLGNEIVSDGSKIYFVANSETGQYLGKVLFASDGTAAGTYPIPFQLSNSIPIPTEPFSLTIANNKVFFIAAGRIWSTNSNLVSPVYIDQTNNPYFPRTLLEFNQKIYTISRVNFGTNDALYETDGTAAGSRIVKTFETSTLSENTSFYFDKTANKIYFRELTDLNTGNAKVNLWTSDGTTTGTIKLKEIGRVSNSVYLRSRNIGNQLIIFTGNTGSNDSLKVWSSDGTIGGTTNIFKQKSRINEVIGIGMNQDKLFFTCLDINQNFEFWETNGTINGTIRRWQNQQFQPKSGGLFGPNRIKFDNILDFNQKLIFWTYDALTNYEPWYFQIDDCPKIIVPFQINKK